ncbi:hypothetical protein [Streptomyces xylophagus]|uniref:hypothetical protein n=1 Tax=Streptomyces xylophagus TaxID=285514 RepID=UPI0005BD893A|nr:hypothetical protein [Streptomyces xylophagus]
MDAFTAGLLQRIRATETDLTRARDEGDDFLVAGVESPTVLGAARLRALGLSTPARPYGSLSADAWGQPDLVGPRRWPLLSPLVS